MAGAGYKLFNTGDVLTAAQVNTYLMEQTVMVFANAAARTTALSGVVSEGMISYLKDTNAVEVYDGSNWVSSDDPNAIQNTIVDAKGDLITATAADTPSRIAVGNNGETLVADSSATTGLRWSAAPSTGNPVINSAMQVWQRGTSIVLGAGTYTADRWYGYRAVAGSTVTRQATNDTTNLPNIQYALRVQRDSGNTSTSAIALATSFESVNSIPFAGRTVTLSFYARAGANFSQASSTLTFGLFSGTGTDQNVMFGYTGQATVASTNAVLTTTWQRFSVSGTVATTATEIGIKIGDFNPVGTAGANDWFEVTGVQIDLGSAALPFRTYSATLAGELAACQRYYWRQTGPNTDTLFGCGGGITGATSSFIMFKHPVTMRIAPSTVDFSTLRVIDNSTGTSYAVSAVAAQSTGQDFTSASMTISGATGGRFAYCLSNNSTTAYIGFSAEL